MKFYVATIPLYLETYTSRISLGAVLLQVKDCGHDKKYQIMQYCDLLHLQSIAYQVGNGATATYKGVKH